MLGCCCGCKVTFITKEPCTATFRGSSLVEILGTSSSGVTDGAGSVQLSIPAEGDYKVKVSRSGCDGATYPLHLVCGATYTLSISCGTTGKVRVANLRCCPPSSGNASVIDAIFTETGMPPITVGGGITTVPSKGGPWTITKPAGDGCKAVSQSGTNAPCPSSPILGSAAQVRDDLVCCQADMLVPKSLTLSAGGFTCALTYGADFLGPGWFGTAYKSISNCGDTFYVETLGKDDYVYADECWAPECVGGRCRNVYGRAIKNSREVRNDTAYVKFRLSCGYRDSPSGPIYGMGLTATYGYTIGYLSDRTQYGFQWWCRDRKVGLPPDEYWIHEVFASETGDCYGSTVGTVGHAYNPATNSCYLSNGFGAYNYRCGAAWMPEGSAPFTTSCNGFYPANTSRGSGFSAGFSLVQSNTSLTIISLESAPAELQYPCGGTQYAPPPPCGYSVTVSS